MEIRAHTVERDGGALLPRVAGCSRQASQLGASECKEILLPSVRVESEERETERLIGK